MYRVFFYINGSAVVAAREFPNLKEATEFANDQPIDSILEIKHHDDKTSNLQD
jgi:hypothetical protein